MPFVPYLLIQRRTSGDYKIFGNALFDFPPDGKLQVLLDAARTSPCVALDMEDMSAESLILQAYTLVNPISSFLGRPLASIRDQLGVLDAEFFREKAVHWPSDSSLTLLAATDGKILIVCSPSSKRPRSVTEENTFTRMKRSKLVATSPSTIAEPSYYENNQHHPSERILDDRPEPDADIAPISLLYDGFGEFLDVFDGVTDVPGLSEVNNVELQKAVDDFAQNMCRFYDNDDRRRTIALPALNSIFSARTGTKFSSLEARPRHAGGPFVLFKNRCAGTQTSAEVELVAYKARSHVGRHMEKHPELFERWRFPGLGMTVVGPDVRFYALIAVDHRYRLVTLTPGLSCIPSASDGRDRKALYRAFAAASVLQARILDDGFRSFTSPFPEVQPLTGRFPSVTKLRKWGSSTEHLSFRIVGYHPDRQGCRLLYFAETSGPETQTIVVKFAREYSVELHAFCADRGHAPRILAFERLPGGWKAIAMEHIASRVTITKSSGLDTHRERWREELFQLVKDFHREGLVHGDLRDANIICDDHRMMLIDFDWGGLDGQACYPTANLNYELLEGRLSDNLKITKDDDIRILRKTIGRLLKVVA